MSASDRALIRWIPNIIDLTSSPSPSPSSAVIASNVATTSSARDTEPIYDRLEVGGQQLRNWVHSQPSRAVLTLAEEDVPFVRGRIRPNQIDCSRHSYINGILIQSRSSHLVTVWKHEDIHDLMMQCLHQSAALHEELSYQSSCHRPKTAEYPQSYRTMGSLSSWASNLRQWKTLTLWIRAR